MFTQIELMVRTAPSPDAASKSSVARRRADKTHEVYVVIGVEFAISLAAAAAGCIIYGMSRPPSSSAGF